MGTWKFNATLWEFVILATFVRKFVACDNLSQIWVCVGLLLADFNPEKQISNFVLKQKICSIMRWWWVSYRKIWYNKQSFLFEGEEEDVKKQVFSWIYKLRRKLLGYGDKWIWSDFSSKAQYLCFISFLLSYNFLSMLDEFRDKSILKVMKNCNRNSKPPSILFIIPRLI